MERGRQSERVKEVERELESGRERVRDRSRTVMHGTGNIILKECWAEPSIGPQPRPSEEEQTIGNNNRVNDIQ